MTITNLPKRQELQDQYFFFAMCIICAELLVIKTFANSENTFDQYKANPLSHVRFVFTYMSLYYGPVV